MSIEARWGSRIENSRQVAARVLKTLRGLRSLHPALARWYPNEKSKGNAWPLTNSLDPDDSSAVVDVVKRLGPVSRDERIPGAGVELVCWNGIVEGDDIFLMCSAGRMVNGLENSFKVAWGIFAPTNIRLLKNRALTEKIMEILVDAWEPDWCQVAGFYTPELGPYDNVKRQWMVPEVGWLLYLARRPLSPRDVPSAHEVRPMGHGGTLIVVADQMIGTSEPAHWALSNRVREDLGLPCPYSIYVLPPELRIPPPEVMKKLRTPDPDVADLVRKKGHKKRRQGGEGRR